MDNRPTFRIAGSLEDLIKAFYAKHGFQPPAETFLEANIEHRLMTKQD